MKLNDSSQGFSSCASRETIPHSKDDYVVVIYLSNLSYSSSFIAEFFQLFVVLIQQLLSQQYLFGSSRFKFTGS